MTAKRILSFTDFSPFHCNNDSVPIRSSGLPNSFQNENVPKSRRPTARAMTMHTSTMHPQESMLYILSCFDARNFFSAAIFPSTETFFSRASSSLLISFISLYSCMPS